MTEFFIEAFALSLSWTTLLAVVFGLFWGVIVGALPGLGSVLAITICLPFTFSMGQVEAVAMILSIYAGSVYGGSLSAILINTPGTPQSAATCLDGYPMAQEGKAGLALGWTTIASVIGGIFSCIVLTVAAPQLAAVALKFGPVETFAVILLGLTCISSISKGSLAKGLLAGVVGLVIKTVGMDPFTGDLRFTFVLFSLSGGLELIAVVVGVFALTEVFSQVADSGVAPTKSDEESKPNRISCDGMVIPPIKDMLKRWGTFLKASAIGSCIGILPGTGAATSAFISYAEVKRSSKNRDKMGQGEPDGIIAAEAANNAVTGGALVPTLALGIPGDAVTAVMLATLILHGITPGVRLMQDQPVIVYSAFITLFICNLLLIFVGKACIRGFSRILKMPTPLLMSMVSLFCMVGTYCVRSSIFDLYVMLIAGLVGFFLRRFKVPVAALVIGMVLGGQCELSLRQGLVLTNNSFAGFFSGHPIAFGIFVVTALLLCWPFVRDRISR